MARRRRARLSWGIIIWLAVLTLIGAGAGLYTFARITYRVAFGPEGGEGQRIFTAINPIFSAESSFIHLTGRPSANPDATAKALESGAVDLVIIRPDLAVPSNGRTVAILRREPVLLVVPANGKVDKVSDLKGKAIGLVKGAALNGALLDNILNYYEVPVDSVQRVEVAAGEVAAAVRQKRVAAFFLIGAVGPGQFTDVIAAITKAGGGAPDFLAHEEAEAIAKRNPTLEKLEIARGAFLGNPAVPDESITTLAVSRRLVARRSMLNWPAGEIARVLLTNKAKMTAELPYAYQLEAPDTDKDVVLPVHPAAAAYVNGEQKSLYDTFESLFWMGWMLCTLVGVSYAAIRSRINRNRHDATADATDRVLEMLSEARGADTGRLDTIEREAERLLQWSLKARANDTMDQERFQFLTFVLDRLHQAIERRRCRIREREMTPASEATN